MAVNRGAFAIVLCVVTLVSAHAFDVEQIDAVYMDKQFRLTLTVIVDAPVAAVEAVLRDYARYPSLDPRILESTVLEESKIVNPPDRSVVLFTKLRACSGVFCRTIKRVERVQESTHELTATVLPERSDVVAGVTRTRIQSLADHSTRISYETQLAPKFWVPPLVGRPLMLRTLRESSIELFRNVEREAQKTVSHP